jgi:hypothetical protein
MSFRPRAYPHPVLREINDDYVDKSEFFGRFTHSSGEGMLTLGIDITLTSDRLNEARADGIAQLAVEVECAGARWKEVFTLENVPASVTIPEANLFGTIRVTPLLIATQEINLEFAGINKEFTTTTFHLFEGDLLAYGPTEALETDHDRSSGDDHYGIKFSLQPDLDPDEYWVACDYDEIIIHCGSNVMQVTKALTEDIRYSPFVFMSYYKDAFVKGMDYLLRSLSRGEELEQTWAKGLKGYIEEKGLSLDSLSAISQDDEQGDHEEVERFVHRLIALDGVQALAKRIQKEGL